MGKYGLAIIAALIVVGGVVFLAGRSGNQPPQKIEEGATSQVPAPGSEDVQETVVEEQEGALVTYTDDGFTPSTITVARGTTVLFVNESSGSMWVASAVHPTHQVLPGFDQLSAGERYTYTFEQEGSWKYHNHLAPSQTGTVVVE